MTRRLLLTFGCLVGAIAFACGSTLAEPKRVAIASIGPHSSLEEAITGFKAALADQGLTEGSAVVYEYGHSNFDPALVPQVLSQLEATEPDLLLTVTTPITQAAVKLVRNKSIPIVFAPVTDPVAAGIVPSWERGSERFVGASNMQSMEAVIGFAEKLLGEIDSFGLLYNPGDANDVAGKALAEAAARRFGLEFEAAGVNAAGEIAQHATALKDVDFIYAIPSNMLMPALPAIASAADRMQVPVISASPAGVRDHVVLGSMSVSWRDVGYHGGLLAAQVLEGQKTSDLANYRPSPSDHTPLISGKRLKELGKELPPSLVGCGCVVD